MGKKLEDGIFVSCELVASQWLVSQLPSKMFLGTGRWLIKKNIEKYRKQTQETLHTLKYVNHYHFEHTFEKLKH